MGKNMGKEVGRLVVRQLNRGRALALERMPAPGFYPDGGGLYLQVTSRGARSWVYRYRAGPSTLRDLGLGPLRLVPLAVARAKAIDAARLRLEGIDPIEAKRGRRAKAKAESARAVTFMECAINYVESHRSGWRNAKHAAQWLATLTTYAEPVAGTLPVSAVDTEVVLKIIDPIWRTKAETAARLRGRVEAILDFARARGYREGENPARWRGHLDQLLPARSKVAKVVHHPALPWREIPEFYAALAAQHGVGAEALRFTILTAARTGESLGATWPEVDFDRALWTIPGSRMKAERDHRVPLSDQAAEILARVYELRSGADGFVFRGQKKARGLSNMALLAVLRRMGRGDLTVHGFRSSFRDWAAEATSFPSDAAELALAHAVGDKVEAAYRRGDQLERRYDLARAWADFVTGGEKCERRSQAKSD
jgi:integrase